MLSLFNRAKEITRLRRKLERDGHPRLQMLLIVAITGSVGFLSSFVFLQAGITAMWLRYLLAFGIAYLAFLFLLWLWLHTKAEDYNDFPDFSGLGTSRDSHNVLPTISGKGGQFGGGGASYSYSHPLEAPTVDPSAIATDDGGSVGEALGTAASAEEFAIPLLILVVLGALLLSSLWVIYSAPVHFAELLVDGALAAGLYHRLRKLEYQHWLETAIRRSIWPFVLTAIIVGAAGWGMQLYAPQAHSLGEVITHINQTRLVQ
jgi:hypothetical protein